MAEKFLHYGHAKTKLLYHLIFSTKYRRNCLSEIRDDIMIALNESEKKSHYHILCAEVDKNHIHILIEFKPFLSITQVVRRLKQYTTNYIWTHKEEYIKKYYWKNKRILWTNGYFCGTIGDVSEKIIADYIKNQG